ncbi:MAG: hypothetical protein NW224_00585 [Leptolyngbyaceae cyanobacterium bins.302]|nr:hypothetical protein [Leptolyngbyaceae cyanobacterium bins.302]
MARRYSRREFLTDAGFALSSSVLLKILAPSSRVAAEIEQAEAPPAKLSSPREQKAAG